MLILINYSYDQRITGRNGKINEWSIIEEAKITRRRMIAALAEPIAKLGFGYAPACHVISADDDVATVTIEATEFISSLRFITAKDKNSLIRLIRESIESLGDSIELHDFIVYKRFSKSPDDIMFMERYIEAHLEEMAEEEGVIKTVNDFYASYNPLSPHADGIPVIVDSELFYPDGGMAAINLMCYCDVLLEGIYDNGIDIQDDSFSNDDIDDDDDDDGYPYDNDEEADDSEDYDEDDDYDDEADDYDDDSDYVPERMTAAERKRLVRGSTYAVDDIIRKHIEDLPGFRFFPGGAPESLMEDSEAGTLQRSDIVIYPREISKENAYELIMTAYRLAAIDMGIDNNVLLSGATIRKTSIRPDKAEPFIKDVNALERALREHPRAFPEELIPSEDDDEQHLVMAIRFRTDFDGLSETPEAWIKEKLRAASHDYGFTFLPRLVEIADDPIEHGFTADYEDFEFDDSNAVSMQGKSGDTTAIFVIGVTYHGDITYEEAKEMLEDMIRKAVDDMDDDSGFTYLKTVFANDDDQKIKDLIEEDF